MTEFNDSHLSGESRTSTNLDELLEQRYDYMLIGSSWDRRCITLAQANMSVGITQVLLPENRGQSGLRDTHDKRLVSYVSSISDEVEIIEERSEELEAVFKRIEDGITGLRKRVDRPLSVLVDLSAMARYFTLGAIAMALNDSVASHVDVFYSEARYGNVIATSTVPFEEYVSSWDTAAVPRLEGDWYPDQRRHFLISVGFEATKIARLVERWDPDDISILFPRPGLLPEYESHAASANQQWMKLYDISDNEVIQASPVDAVAAWSTVTKPRNTA